jgi:hypothetical protein
MADMDTEEITELRAERDRLKQSLARIDIFYHEGNGFSEPDAARFMRGDARAALAPEGYQVIFVEELRAWYRERQLPQPKWLKER